MVLKNDVSTISNSVPCTYKPLGTLWKIYAISHHDFNEGQRILHNKLTVTRIIMNNRWQLIYQNCDKVRRKTAAAVQQSCSHGCSSHQCRHGNTCETSPGQMHYDSRRCVFGQVSHAARTHLTLTHPPYSATGHITQTSTIRGRRVHCYALNYSLTDQTFHTNIYYMYTVYFVQSASNSERNTEKDKKEKWF